MAKMIQCPTCKGTGVESVDKYDEDGNWCGSDDEKCHYCKGSGKVDYNEEYWNNRGSKYNPFGRW